jgi:hypothetical protein
MALTIARRATRITKLQFNGPPIVRRLHETDGERRNDRFVEDLGGMTHANATI